MTALAKALLAERARREKLPKAIQSVVDELFPRQQELIESASKRIVAHPGRRSGKTHALVAGALRAAGAYPGSVVPIFERTLTCTAANTFWSDLRAFDERHKLGVDFHNTYRIATLPNRSQIMILGADTIEAADKHRGGKFPWAAVDEAGGFRSKVLDFMLTDVLEPATIDYNGTIVVAGTPGIDPIGTWYDLCQNPVWTRFHWTMLDNPVLGEGTTDAERYASRLRWLENLRNEHGWTEDTPRYRREYLGLWTLGGDDKCYSVTPSCLIDELPDEDPYNPWRYWLGLDLGYDDPAAFVVMAGRGRDPNKYVVESYEQSELIPSAVAAHVERLIDRYDGFVGIWADTGGYGKAVAVEMTEKFGLPISGAKKRDKRVYMEHLGGDIASCRLRIVRRTNRVLIEDLTALGWNDARTDNDRGQRDHLPDALLYAHRHSPVYERGLGDRDAPERGSAEWLAAQEEAIIARDEELAMAEAEARWDWLLGDREND